MEEIVLKAQPREVTGKQVKVLRRQGRLPAVLYGRTVQPMLVTLDMKETSRILPTITSSHLVVVDINGQQHTTLVKERQRHPVSGGLLHVDFQVVSMTEKLRTNVVLVFEGEAPAVKNFSGVLVENINEIEVECLPGALPERIMVNVSKLAEIGSAIYVRDLGLSTDVEVLTDPNEVVVVVTAPAAEEAAPALEGAAEPEVIEKGKKEEEF